MVTLASMMYTSVAVMATITGGSSSSGCDRKAAAPLRNVAPTRSRVTAAAKPGTDSRGP
jgi:hypothetical protein